MSKDIKYVKKEVEVCEHDLVVVFPFGKMLLDKKRKLLDKVMRKIPSRFV